MPTVPQAHLALNPKSYRCRAGAPAGGRTCRRWTIRTTAARTIVSAQRLYPTVFRIECACHHKRRGFRDPPPTAGREMTLRVPVLARFPWPGGTPFQAGAVIPLTAPAASLPDPFRTPLDPLDRRAGMASPRQPSPPRLRASIPVESVRAFGYDSTAPGGVPEWLKGADCKSVGAAYLGSNPSSPTRPG